MQWFTLFSEAFCDFVDLGSFKIFLRSLSSSQVHTFKHILFINADTIHVNINIFQLGFRKKSKTYMNLSPINFEQNTCYGE